MKKHFQYASYVFRHKWWVFVAGLKIGAPVWRLLIHDWSKFLPCEWSPYVNSFYGGFKWKERPQKIKDAFNSAWNHHQKANKHHWQYWLLTNDSDDPKHKPLPMPESYAREMVADWMGAGRAITGKWECPQWYAKNKDKIILHDDTRLYVETLLSSLGTTEELNVKPA